MNPSIQSLQDRTVVVIGRGSGIARAITDASRAAGARVVVAGRDRPALAWPTTTRTSGPRRST